MARIKLTLDPGKPEHQRMLLHGASNAGKTFLAGSALVTAITAGKTGYFIDTKGEEGTRSLASFSLGSGIAETVETYKDFQEALKEVTASGLDLLVVDSLKFIWKMIMIDVLKSDRAPVISKTSTDWQDLYRAYDKMLLDLIAAARDIIVICPSDVSMDQVKGERAVTPDLPGRKIPDTVAAFDMVGYMEANAVGGSTRRVIHFEGMSGVTTKIRAGKQAVKKPFVISEGVDAWKDLQEELDKHV